MPTPRPVPARGSAHEGRPSSEGRTASVAAAVSCGGSAAGGRAACRLVAGGGLTCAGAAVERWGCCGHPQQPQQALPTPAARAIRPGLESAAAISRWRSWVAWRSLHNTRKLLPAQCGSRQGATLLQPCPASWPQQSRLAEFSGCFLARLALAISSHILAARLDTAGGAMASSAAAFAPAASTSGRLAAPQPPRPHPGSLPARSRCAAAVYAALLLLPPPPCRQAPPLPRPAACCSLSCAPLPLPGCPPTAATQQALPAHAGPTGAGSAGSCSLAGRACRRAARSRRARAPAGHSGITARQCGA